MVLMSSAALAADLQITSFATTAANTSSANTSTAATTSATTAAATAAATAANAAAALTAGATTAASGLTLDTVRDTLKVGCINAYCVAINWLGIYHPEACNLLNPPMLDLIPSTTRTQNTPGYAMKGQII